MKFILSRAIGLWKKFKLKTTKFSIYVDKHSLLVKYRERRRGVFRTFLAWSFVGFAAVSFGYALNKTSIPGPVALFLQSLSIFAFPLIKCLFDDGFSCLKVVERASIVPQHLSVSQRRWSIVIRSTLGILAGACFEYSKVFSSIVDNSAIFGADAIVVAFFMSAILKRKLGTRWIWIVIALLGIVTIIYMDSHSFNLLRSFSGALAGLSSVILLAVVLLMTSYMVYHDNPITIVFYQSLAAVVYSSLYLVGSIIYLYANNDYATIHHYLSFFNINTLKNLPIQLLCLGGFLYGWALLLFFQALYFTEVLILATLGYFLSPIMAVYEWWFYHAPFTIKDLVNTMFITVGTAGLYKCEKKSKEKEALFIVPITDSLQENLHSIIKDYKDKKISRYYYLSWMYEFEKLLYLIPKIIKKTNIDTIKIKENEILFETKAPKIVIEDDGSFRSPTFEMLNFGEYEPKIAALLFSILQDGDTILDIGAGIGWYSLNFSKNFPTSSIYAFEPIKELFQILEKNIKTNNATNVRIFNFGIDNSKRINKFYYLRNQHEYLKNIFHPMELDCRVRSLSEVVDFLDLKKLDFIKQDFKFKENAFLTSNENSIIDKFKPLIMFSLGQYCDEEFIKTFQKDLQLLENLGYEKLIIGEDLNHNVKKDRHYLLFHSEKHKNIIYKNI